MYVYVIYIEMAIGSLIEFICKGEWTFHIP